MLDDTDSRIAMFIGALAGIIQSARDIGFTERQIQEMIDEAFKPVSEDAE